MACQDTGQILKHIIGIVIAVLLTHECVVETLDFQETSIEFSYIDGQLNHRSPRNMEQFELAVEVNAPEAVVIEQIRASLASITFPLQLDNSTKITAANITTVCQPNVTKYQCVCEDDYAWSYNNCQTYEACDDISFGSCECISAFPSDGEMCALKSELAFTDFLCEIELETSSEISVINEMRRYLQSITFPLQFSELVEVLDVDITTVCNFNDSGYRCVCEDQYFWPCDKCKDYGSCDGITNNTCSCINDIPSDRQFCQTVNETKYNTVCGQPPSVTPVSAEYLTEIQIDAENTTIIDQLMSYLMSFNLPYTVSDSTNITEINTTTVCSLNEKLYQCKCEGLFVWLNDTCHSYEACDVIVDGSCTCINALPIDGQFCQLKEVPAMPPPITPTVTPLTATNLPPPPTPAATYPTTTTTAATPLSTTVAVPPNPTAATTPNNTTTATTTTTTPPLSRTTTPNNITVAVSPPTTATTPNATTNTPATSTSLSTNISPPTTTATTQTLSTTTTASTTPLSTTTTTYPNSTTVAVTPITSVTIPTSTTTTTTVAFPPPTTTAAATTPETTPPLSTTTTTTTTTTHNNTTIAVPLTTATATTPTTTTTTTATTYPLPTTTTVYVPITTTTAAATPNTTTSTTFPLPTTTTIAVPPLTTTTSTTTSIATSPPPPTTADTSTPAATSPTTTAATTTTVAVPPPTNTAAATTTPLSTTITATTPNSTTVAVPPPTTTAATTLNATTTTPAIPPPLSTTLPPPNTTTVAVPTTTTATTPTPSTTTKTAATPRLSTTTTTTPNSTTVAVPPPTTIAATTTTPATPPPLSTTTTLPNTTTVAVPPPPAPPTTSAATTPTLSTTTKTAATTTPHSTTTTTTPNNTTITVPPPTTTAATTPNATTNTPATPPISTTTTPPNTTTVAFPSPTTTATTPTPSTTTTTTAATTPLSTTTTTTPNTTTVAVTPNTTATTPTSSTTNTPNTTTVAVPPPTTTAATTPNATTPLSTTTPPPNTTTVAVPPTTTTTTTSTLSSTTTTPNTTTVAVTPNTTATTPTSSTTNTPNTTTVAVPPPTTTAATTPNATTTTPATTPPPPNTTTVAVPPPTTNNPTTTTITTVTTSLPTTTTATTATTASTTTSPPSTTVAVPPLTTTDATTPNATTTPAPTPLSTTTTPYTTTAGAVPPPPLSTTTATTTSSATTPPSTTVSIPPTPTTAATSHTTTATTTAAATTSLPTTTVVAVPPTTTTSPTTTATIPSTTTTTTTTTIPTATATTRLITTAATTPTTTTTTTAATAPTTTATTTIAATTTTAVTSPTTTAATMTTTTTTQKVLKMSIRLNQNFDTSLNSHSEMYHKFASTIKSAIEDGYKSLSVYIQNSVQMTKFRPGSIIADYTISVTTNILNSSNSNNFALANLEVLKILQKEGIPVALTAFSESEQAILSTAEKWYAFQKMELRCKYSRSVNVSIRWTVNDQDPTDTVRYSISPDHSILIVNNATEKDTGRYSCIIDRDTIPYIQWQTIILEERPNILLSTNELKFQCEDKLVLLTCCEKKYDVEWIPIPSGDEVTPQVDGCITLRHKIMKRNCENETFTCRIMDQVLKDFGYSLNRVTVQKIKEEFSCKNDTLGDGNENQFVTGPCEKNWDGSITYQCTSGNWMQFRRDCKLQVISDLQRKVEFLIVEQIPEFVAQLSSVTVQNNQIITHSPLTVQTIVEILVNIASILQNIIIDKAVMENFLKTVNVLVSDKAAASWQSLTKENTSISLLSAIENVTARLSDVDFTFTETFIELNRTIIKNSYRGKSNLPNATTEILIPHVLNTTSLTVLVFTKLDKVLPSYNSGNLVSHINGDVVIVKVNETINNISFTFDITDQSLVNPQCVFWNFYLNAWDSTGCENKPSGNETGKITCECNHTTTFSILMFSPNDQIALDYITYIGVSILMASLIVCLIIEIIMWKSMTRDDTSYMRHVSIVNIAVCLLIANICLIIGAAITEQEQPTSVGRCSPVVFFMHFFYLAVFFWMLISALLLFYRTVIALPPMSRAKMMIIAFIVSYGAPLLIAVITVASTAGQENYISKRNSCWLNWYESKALLAFVIPALTTVAINLVVLIVVLYKMLGRGVDAGHQSDDEKRVLLVIAICVAILTPLFGLTWGFGIGTMVSQDFGIHVVFALLNSLQGFLILVLGTLLDSKIRDAVAERLSISNLTRSNRFNHIRSTRESSSSRDVHPLRRRHVTGSTAYSSSSIRSSSSNESFALMNI